MNKPKWQEKKRKEIDVLLAWVEKWDESLCHFAVPLPNHSISFSAAQTGYPNPNQSTLCFEYKYKMHFVISNKEKEKKGEKKEDYGCSPFQKEN